MDNSLGTFTGVGSAAGPQNKLVRICVCGKTHSGSDPCEHNRHWTETGARYTGGVTFRIEKPILTLKRVISASSGFQRKCS